jgi:hypothetical protein
MSEAQPQRMVLEFPPDSAPILQTIAVYQDGELKHTYHIAPDSTLVFMMHTPDGSFTYTVDNKRKTLTTESDKPFLA